MRHSAGTWSGKTSEVPYKPNIGTCLIYNQKTQ